jgi:hypothetical protein
MECCLVAFKGTNHLYNIFMNCSPWQHSTCIRCKCLAHACQISNGVTCVVNPTRMFTGPTAMVPSKATDKNSYILSYKFVPHPFVTSGLLAHSLTTLPKAGATTPSLMLTSAACMPGNPCCGHPHQRHHLPLHLTSCQTDRTLDPHPLTLHHPSPPLLCPCPVLPCIMSHHQVQKWRLHSGSVPPPTPWAAQPQPCLLLLWGLSPGAAGTRPHP